MALPPSPPENLPRPLAVAKYARIPAGSGLEGIKVKVKIHTLDIAPLRSESPSQKRSG